MFSFSQNQMETKQEEEEVEKAMDWDLLIPPVIRCNVESCREEITEGSQYPGRNYYVCHTCMKNLDVPTDMLDNFIEFHNTPVEINSKYLREPTPHTRTSEDGYFQVDIRLLKTIKRRLCKPENHRPGRCTGCLDDPYKISIRMTGLEYRTLYLVSRTTKFHRYETSNSLYSYDNIPTIKPGDLIAIRPGVFIKVDESYVDPRDRLEMEYDEEWTPLFEALQKDFPSDVRKFRKRITTDTKISNLVSFYNKD